MSRIVPIEIEPVKIKTASGKELQLLLTAGGINRLKRKFGVKSIKEMMQLEEEAVLAVLYEALIDKEGMSEDQFYDSLPFQPNQLGQALKLLFGASYPDPTEAATSLPSLGTPTAQAQ